MKLSMMNNDQACEALVRLTTPVANIADDPAVEPLLKELASHEGDDRMNGLKVIAKMLPRIVPLLLKDHKADVYEVISVLSGKTANEVGKMRLTETIFILKDSIDGELLDFFKSSSPATNAVEEKSE